MHLFAWHYDSLSPRVELDALAQQLHSRPPPKHSQPSSTPNSAYAEERRLLEERRVLPLVLLPEYVGIAPPVRNWMPARWGEWRLADVWLEKGEIRSTRANAGASPKILHCRMAGECIHEFSQQSFRDFPGHRAGFRFPRRLRRDALHPERVRAAWISSAPKPWSRNSSKEFAQRGEVVVQQVENITNAEITVRWLSIWRAPTPTLLFICTMPTARRRTMASISSNL